MTLAKHRTEMVEYLVDRIDGFGESVVPKASEIVPGVVSSYILIGDENNDSSIVLLLDRDYPKGVFKKIYNGASSVKKNVAVVVLKDETTFFRPAFNGDFSPRRYNRSVNYPDDIRDFCKEFKTEDKVLLQPEENFLVSQKIRYNEKPIVQYFRPSSDDDAVQPALETFLFTPVSLNYGYIDSATRVKPRSRNSARLHSFEKIGENSGRAVLKKNYSYKRPSEFC